MSRLDNSQDLVYPTLPLGSIKFQQSACTKQPAQEHKRYHLEISSCHFELYNRECDNFPIHIINGVKPISVIMSGKLRSRACDRS